MSVQNNQNQPIKARYTKKHRDKQGRIVGYTLQDSTGKKVNFYSEDLKMHIKNKNLEVTNLKLTSDGKLIDKVEKEIIKPVKKQQDRPFRAYTLEELSEELESYIRFECSDIGGSKFDELYANNKDYFGTINLIREELIARKCLSAEQFELWMTGSDSVNRGYNSYYHNKYKFIDWLKAYNINEEQSKRVRFMVEMDKILNSFINQMGSGRVTIKSVDYTDDYLQGTVSELYHNYYGDMYGITFGIDDIKSEFYITFHRNCMSKPIFKLTEKLTKPIETSMNLNKIKIKFNESVSLINKWIAMDEKLNDVRDDSKTYFIKMFTGTKFDNTTVDNIDSTREDGYITASLPDFYTLIDLIINVNNNNLTFDVNEQNEAGELTGEYKLTVKCLDKTVETLNLAYTIILTSEIKQVNMKEVIIYKGKVQK